MTNIMIFYQNIFLCSLACESCSSKLGYSCPDLKSSRDSGFSSKIWTIPPTSGLLDTLRGFLRGPGPCSLGKKKIETRGLQNAGNALKLSIIPSPRYFCNILNILRPHQADLFGSWGGACAPPLPTGLVKVTVQFERRFRLMEHISVIS